MEKLLFICTANASRSPTAADLFAGSPHYLARSAGTAPGARVRVTQELIDWADRIFVMSERADGHASYLRHNFDLKGKEIIDLDISDFIYEYNDPTLIAILKEKLSKYLAF